MVVMLHSTGGLISKKSRNEAVQVNPFVFCANYVCTYVNNNARIVHLRRSLRGNDCRSIKHLCHEMGICCEISLLRCSLMLFTEVRP